jgi:hypothetical protein
MRDMRDRMRWGALGASGFVALCSFLVACGVASPGGLVTSTTPGAEATVAVNGTPGTLHPVATCAALGSPACMPSPTATASEIAPPGAVRIVLDQTSYAAGDTARVSIENGLSVKIAVSDHHTDCTYVVLEQFLGGMWQPIGTCKLMTPTRLVELPAGSITPQRIGIPTGPSAAGTYRVELPYGSGGPAYSATFTVG